jgi:hypothetical protein
MSKLNRPTTTTMRNKTSVVDNAFRNQSNTNPIESWIERQAYVDRWNLEYVGKKGLHDKDLIEHFKKIQLDGQHLIIHMFMENVIKDVYTNEQGQTMIIPGISQIDGRKRTTDVPHYIDTPFPLIDKGVIMAISPYVQLYYYELKEKLAKYDKEKADAVIIPEVGDIVYTNHFLFKDSRYYPDKQAKTGDFVRNQEDINLSNFDFLFKVTTYEIESIVKRDCHDKMMDSHVSITDKIKSLLLANKQS